MRVEWGIALLFCLVAGVGEVLGKSVKEATGDERETYITLVLDWAMSWGTWGQAEYCPPGTFATAFEIKVESEDATDDTSMNGIRLYCNDVSGDDNKQTKELTVSSTVQKWGDWMGKRECPSGEVLTGLRMKSEEDQGNFVDDTAANDLDMQCLHSTFTLNGGGNHWGYWSTWASCPEGWGICGLETRVESESAGDDTALNDVRMYCCSFTPV